MKQARRRLLAVVLLAAIQGSAAFAPRIGRHIEAAVAEPARPAADRRRDAWRRPAEVLAFSRIRTGDRVLEIVPDTGYFTRLLSRAVGPSGHVYAAGPQVAGGERVRRALNLFAPEAPFDNVTLIELSPEEIERLRDIDLVWTSQNYHDLHLKGGGRDVPAFDRSLLSVLRPGGRLLIADHTALDGAGARDVDRLHRIDPDFVAREVTGAGFDLVDRSDLLRNPADDRTLAIFDPKVRDHTDQFLQLFAKPRAARPDRRP